MTSLVNELQQSALDEQLAIEALLRKALVVTSKLGVEDFETWVERAGGPVGPPLRIADASW
jgi:AbiTii